MILGKVTRSSLYNLPKSLTIWTQFLLKLYKFSGTTISSHRRCSVSKGVLRNFAKFTGKHLCQSLIFNKVAGLRPTTLLKKRLWHGCFLENFAKFLRSPFLQNTSGRLVLDHVPIIWQPVNLTRVCVGNICTKWLKLWTFLLNHLTI